MPEIAAWLFSVKAKEDLIHPSSPGIQVNLNSTQILGGFVTPLPRHSAFNFRIVCALGGSGCVSFVRHLPTACCGSLQLGRPSFLNGALHVDAYVGCCSGWSWFGNHTQKETETKPATWTVPPNLRAVTAYHKSNNHRQHSRRNRVTLHVRGVRASDAPVSSQSYAARSNSQLFWTTRSRQPAPQHQNANKLEKWIIHALGTIYERGT